MAVIDFSSKASINRDTKLCMSLAARPGNFGTRFQNHLYGEMRLDYIYKAFTTKDLDAAIAGIRSLGVRGCAISMPFKEACIPLIDSLDPSAAAIGAVNTIVNDNGHLRGFNTDYIAVERLIDQYAVAVDAPLILRGSGGMGKAVALALHNKGFRNGILVARNETSGPALAGAIGFRWVRDLSAIDQKAAEGALLVNVTPIGMEGGPDADSLSFPKSMIEASRVVFDVVAMPVETPLIRMARAAGCTTISGDEVLVLQALEQFVLYVGIRPAMAQVLAAKKAATAS